MANRLLTKTEVSTQIWQILQDALDEAEVPEDQRADVTVMALDWLNRALVGPGVEITTDSTQPYSVI
jgi:hypothetical protein